MRGDPRLYLYPGVHSGHARRARGLEGSGGDPPEEHGASAVEFARGEGSGGRGGGEGGAAWLFARRDGGAEGEGGFAGARVRASCSNVDVYVQRHGMLCYGMVRYGVVR